MATRSYDDPTTGGARRPPGLIRALECARPSAEPLAIELSPDVAVVFGRGDSPLQSSIEGGALVSRVETDDEWMSSAHARLRSDGGTWILEDRGSKNGVVVNGATVSEARLGDGDWFRLGATYFAFRDPGGGEPGELARAFNTLQPVLLGELSKVEPVATTAIPILICGETGTGKEVLARAIHRLSGRDGPFVPVNCGALPPNLVESELFGFKRGAFSGADRDSVGLVRASSGGTLFLDEIAELSEQSQVTLLRALQESEVRPIGSTTPVPIDLRVIGATHEDLGALASAGRFRDDLYARLVGLVVQLPALRDRMEDFGQLVAAHLGRLCPDRCDLSMTRAAGAALFEHRWPRNIRELGSALEIAVVVSGGATIDLDHLPAEIRSPAPLHPRPRPASTDSKREAIVASLRDSGGNVSGAARALGYSRAHFHRLMKAFGIDPARFR